MVSSQQIDRKMHPLSLCVESRGKGTYLQGLDQWQFLYRVVIKGLTCSKGYIATLCLCLHLLHPVPPIDKSFNTRVHHFKFRLPQELRSPYKVRLAVKWHSENQSGALPLD